MAEHSKIKDGRAIAASVDPNISDDVCTWCRHFEWNGNGGLEGGKCRLGHESYFRSLSNWGVIYVSDCGAGEMLPELAAIDKNKQETVESR